MTYHNPHHIQALPLKFSDPNITADGARRAEVAFDHLETLWINTGTLCNIECANCYIESSPENDRLAYITSDEVRPLIEQASRLGAKEIGFTGGEPFMNPHIFTMLEIALSSGLTVLILTNGMRPMMRPAAQKALKQLIDRYDDHLKLRVSLDHFTAKLHDKERGIASFNKAIEGLCWLSQQGATLSVAGRSCLSESEKEARTGYQALFDQHNITINANNPIELILFPEMSETSDPPEITTACWDILDQRPQDQMCATSRMVVKRKSDQVPSILSCTLLPYNDQFDLGHDLEGSFRPIKLNHPYCATFCVLGGSSCSG